MLTGYRGCVVLVFLLVFFSPTVYGVPFHVTYLWHMHQPIYYPYENILTTEAHRRFSFNLVSGDAPVWDSDRINAYRYWPKIAVQQGADRGMAHAGAQMSYSGSLTENNRNIWGGNYNWAADVRWARNSLKTSLNHSRLDVVGIPYHHSLMPLTCKEAMVMQIRLHKEQYQEAWDTGGQYSKGFWPPECAFAVWIIPALVEEGVEWVIVDNGHLFRTVPDFPWTSASSCRPNKADVINPSSIELNSRWIQLQNIWAPTPVLAPWSYQPHYAQYVNPWTGQRQKIIVVPAGRYEGNENARGGYGAFKPENVWGAHVGVNTNAARPMLILCHSDGDNYGMKNSDAWNAQHGLFLNMCQSNPDFEHTTVQDYLSLFPPDTNDIIHVEPGTWIGIDGGTPYFEKWLSYEDRNGEMPDMWSWSVLVAGVNRVLTADALENSYLNLGGGRTMDDVEWGLRNDTARAWHYYLNAETSCYWYWDYDRNNPWDGNATRAVNLAVAEANKVLARHPGSDPVGPSIFPPQRLPYNPGGKMWNEASNAPSDFTVWTFVDDVSGLASVKLCWRVDLDGTNPVAEIDNEVYAHNPAKVTAWSNASMTASWWPTVKGPNVPDPACRARRYTGSITGQRNVLIDYFVEAVDTAGNTNRSEIFHVWVGAASQAGEVVTYAPDPPRRGQHCTITYHAAGRNLSSANPVYIHLGFNNWAVIVSPDPAMTGTLGGAWSHTFFVSNAFTQIDCVFHNGAGTWDNNGGADWHKATVEGGPVPSAVSFDPASPNSCNPVLITYSPNETGLTNATQVYIHLLYNSGQQTNRAPMTKVGLNWLYTTQILPYGTTNLVCSFNDDPSPSAGNWDDNNGAGWKVTVAGCTEPPPPPYVTITNPPTETVTVAPTLTVYRVAGTCGTGVVGFLQWTNSLGGAGTLPVSISWSVDVSLAVGTNVITVRGTNQPAAGILTNAADTASNYGGSWTNGSNRGTGFGPWTLYASAGPGNSGHFIGTAGNLGLSWGLYANNGALSEAVRPFSLPLASGQTFRVRMQNHWVLESAGSIGVALRNGSGATLWQLFFNGGNLYYDGTDGMTDIGWTSNGLSIAFTLTASNAYAVAIQPPTGPIRQYTGTVTGQIAQFRAWTFNNGPGSQYDFFINNLLITQPGSGGAGETFSDTISIVRPAGFADNDADGMDDAWELEKFGDLTTATAMSDWDGDRATDFQEFLAGTDPKDPQSLLKITAIQAGGLPGVQIIRWASVGDRVYTLLATTNLMEEFSPRGTGLSGNPPENSYTDAVIGVGQRFYRVRTQRE